MFIKQLHAKERLVFESFVHRNVCSHECPCGQAISNMSEHFCSIYAKKQFAESN